MAYYQKFFMVNSLDSVLITYNHSITKEGYFSTLKF